MRPPDRRDVEPRDDALPDARPAPARGGALARVVGADRVGVARGGAEDRDEGAERMVGAERETEPEPDPERDDVGRVVGLGRLRSPRRLVAPERVVDGGDARMRVGGAGRVIGSLRPASPIRRVVERVAGGGELLGAAVRPEIVPSPRPGEVLRPEIVLLRPEIVPVRPETVPVRPVVTPRRSERVPVRSETPPSVRGVPRRATDPSSVPVAARPPIRPSPPAARLPTPEAFDDPRGSALRVPMITPRSPEPVPARGVADRPMDPVAVPVVTRAPMPVARPLSRLSDAPMPVPTAILPVDRP